MATAPVISVNPRSDPAYLRQVHLGHLLRQAGVPLRFQPGFESYEARSPQYEVLRERAVEWVSQYDRRRSRGLSMTGATGCGKTHLAAAIARALIERKVSVRWINAAELCMKLRSTFGRHGDAALSEEDLLDELSEPDVLVLDDLGVERPSAWITERLYVLFSRRHEACKTLIFTSNYAGRDLIERLRSSEDPQVADRLISRLMEMVESLGDFPAIDWRKEGYRRRREGAA